MTHRLDFFGPGAKAHHVGLAVASIAALVPDAEITHDQKQKVKVAFVDIAGQSIELIEPADEKSPVSDNLAKGQKLVHIAIEVPDIEGAIAAARPHGFHRLAKPVPATAFDDRSIAWLFSRQYGLFELIEAAA